MTDTPRNLGLWALFGLQAFCALFFLGDAVADIFGLEQAIGIKDTDTFEYVVAVALGLSLVFTGRQLRETLLRQRRMQDQLKAASGAFWDVLEEHFDRWGLTPSERDVAILAVKGLTIAEMAALRQTKDGTIKAQCNAVYRKAGVSGRPQLLSLFIEELMADPLVPQSAPSAP